MVNYVKEFFDTKTSNIMTLMKEVKGRTVCCRFWNMRNNNKKNACMHTWTISHLNWKSLTRLLVIRSTHLKIAVKPVLTDTSELQSP